MGTGKQVGRYCNSTTILVNVFIARIKRMCQKEFLISSMHHVWVVSTTNLKPKNDLDSAQQKFIPNVNDF